jgi:hypothetical protein
MVRSFGPSDIHLFTLFQLQKYQTHDPQWMNTPKTLSWNNFSYIEVCYRQNDEKYIKLDLLGKVSMSHMSP